MYRSCDTNFLWEGRKIRSQFFFLLQTIKHGPVLKDVTMWNRTLRAEGGTFGTTTKEMPKKVHFKWKRWGYPWPWKTWNLDTETAIPKHLLLCRVPLSAPAHSTAEEGPCALSGMWKHVCKTRAKLDWDEVGWCSQMANSLIHTNKTPCIIQWVRNRMWNQSLSDSGKPLRFSYVLWG